MRAPDPTVEPETQAVAPPRYRKETPATPPRCATPSRGAGPSRSRISGARRRPARILVVDDYDDTRELYRDYLVASGHLCDEAADGAEALAKARTLRPNVIIMDLAMPVLDGLAAIRRLRESAETAASGIIVLTGQEGIPVDHGRRAKALGADRFLTKPCLPRDLARIVAELLAELEERGRGRLRSSS